MSEGVFWKIEGETALQKWSRKEYEKIFSGDHDKPWVVPSVVKYILESGSGECLNHAFLWKLTTEGHNYWESRFARRSALTDEDLLRIREIATLQGLGLSEVEQKND